MVPADPAPTGSGRPPRVHPAPAWVVAGAPGAGKSTVAARLLALVDAAGGCVPARLDKDTMYGGFVGATLAAGGRADGEREGPWYDAHVKVHEYRGMTAVARQLRQAGTPVLLDAPFTGQIRDPEQWDRWVVELGGQPVRLLWVHCTPALLRERLSRRGRPQDGGKLADFDAWTARMRPDEPPPVAHVAVDATADEAELATVLQRLRADDGAATNLGA